MDRVLRRWFLRSCLVGLLLVVAAGVGDPVGRPAVPGAGSPRRSTSDAPELAAARVEAVGSFSPDAPFDADDVVDLVDYDWEPLLAGWTVTFRPGREDLLGGTWTGERRIEIYVREDHSPTELAMTLAHELAHALDATHLLDDDRAAWADARGIDVGDWWVDGGGNDFAAGSGDLAESFAVWVVGGEGYAEAGPPDAADLVVLEELFDLDPAG